MTRRHRQSGLTLIEVMIAILIMALLSLLAWRALDSIERADTQLKEHNENAMNLLHALQQLERDIELRATVELAMLQGSGEDAAGTPAAPASPANDAAAAARKPPATELLPPSLRVRRNNQLPFHFEVIRAAPAQPGQWQRVQWWVKDQTLYRAAGPASPAWPLQTPGPDDKVAVLDQVKEFEIRAWEPGKGWTPLPKTSASSASTGLEISLVQRKGHNDQRFRRVIALN